MDDVREILNLQDGSEPPVEEDRDGVKRVGRKRGSAKQKVLILMVMMDGPLTFDYCVLYLVVLLMLI